jgi:hypothetical protein
MADDPTQTDEPELPREDDEELGGVYLPAAPYYVPPRPQPYYGAPLLEGEDYWKEMAKRMAIPPAPFDPKWSQAPFGNVDDRRSQNPHPRLYVGADPTETDPFLPENPPFLHYTDPPDPNWSRMAPWAQPELPPMTPEEGAANYLQGGGHFARYHADQERQEATRGLPNELADSLGRQDLYAVLDRLRMKEVLSGMDELVPALNLHGPTPAEVREYYRKHREDGEPDVVGSMIDQYRERQRQRDEAEAAAAGLAQEEIDRKSNQ